MTLEELGWDPFFQRQLDKEKDGLTPARITAEYAGCYSAEHENGACLAVLGGNIKHLSRLTENLPVAGDWVLLGEIKNSERAQIKKVLTRKTVIARKAAGKEEIRQPFAANIDTVFIVQGLDDNYNPRRLERFLTATAAEKVKIVVILNKKDLSEAPEKAEEETRKIATGIPVVILDSVAKEGYEKLIPYIGKNKTVVFIGSSGVGKSTIINNLGAPLQKTAQVQKKNSKGRHTTTTRKLIRLPSGALVIDTPGIKELSVWDAAQGLTGSFSDIEQLGLRCRFSRCRHLTEPGCAVRAAISAGKLSQERLDSYIKIKTEDEARRKRLLYTDGPKEDKSVKYASRSKMSRKKDRI